MNRLPNEIITAILPLGLTEDNLIYWVVCDRSMDGAFVDTYLLLGKKQIVILSDGADRSQDKVFRGFLMAGKAKPPQHRIDVSKLSIETLEIDKIDSVQIVNLVASGMVVVKEGEESRTISAFTNGHMSRASKFANLFNKLKKDEEISDQDLDDSHERSAYCPKCGMMYPHRDRKVCPKCMKKHAIFARLLSFAGKYKALIFFTVLFMLLNAGTGLVIPYFQGVVFFDQALKGEGAFASQLGLVILLIVIFRTLSLLFGVAFGIINAKLAAYVAFDLKATVFSSMQRLSLSFFQKKQTGQLMTRVNNDATELQHFFVDGISYFIVNAMNIIGIVVILLVLDWKLTLLCFIPMPFVILIVQRVFPRLWRMSWRRHRKVSAMNSVISDTMRGSRVVKAFGKEQKEIERFQRANMSFSDIEQSFNKYSNTVFPILNVVTQLGGIIIWAFGGWQVMQGDFSFGKMMTFISYMYLLYGPIQFMNNIVGWWSYCMSAAQRIFEIQDAVPDVLESPNAVVLQPMKGHIEVNNVSFGYEPNKEILSKVSMEAKPGQMVGVVGHSGAGKSTLVNLISRLYDVTEGEIKIDGTNLKDLSMNTLRDQIGIVSQEIYVFMGTIAENIAYANPDCSMEDIIRAAKIANAHDFIMKLPDGYDTIVGTGGHNLSGGERQRISIARAVLHNPRILILDEATASLDTETELQIQEALESLIHGRTTIAIAHRLSTLRNADYLVVMDKGKVVESGTHDELMEKQGVYNRLVKKHDEALQMKGVG